MYKVNTYQPTRTVVFNPGENQRLISVDTESLARSITAVAGKKMVRAGAILATDNKLLKRAKLITDVPTAATQLYVNNPWAFAVGDALRVISAPGDSVLAEDAAIVGATGASLGTIVAIESAAVDQRSRITLTSAVVGNVLKINIEGVMASYAIASTTIADEVSALSAQIANAIATVDSMRYVTATPMGTYVQIDSSRDYGIVEFTAAIAQGSGASLGAIETSTDLGLGRITLSAALAADLAQGTKVGTVNQIPLGIFDSEFDFGDYPHGIAPEQAITPLYGGQFYLDALPYIDGQVTRVLNNAAFIPAYG